LVTACCGGPGPAAGGTRAHAGTRRVSFARAKDGFRKKACDSAVRRLKDVLFPVERLADRDLLFEARAMLGACFADSGAREQAKIEFEKALQLKPREVLDSLFYSERAVRLFDDTKADVENRSEERRVGEGWRIETRP